MQTFPLTIVSPARAVFSGPVSMVEIPGLEGDFGVLAGHAPFFSMIRPGVITVRGEGEAGKRFFVTAGYADVSPEGTTILSDHIEDLATVNAQAARDELEAAKGALEVAENPEERRAAEKRLGAATALVAAIQPQA